MTKIQILLNSYTASEEFLIFFLFFAIVLVPLMFLRIYMTRKKHEYTVKDKADELFDECLAIAFTFEVNGYCDLAKEMAIKICCSIINEIDDQHKLFFYKNVRSYINKYSVDNYLKERNEKV